MAIDLHTAGSWVAANATTQTVTLPTHSTGDMLLVRVAFKHATMPTTVTCGTAGWAKLGEKNSAGGASSNGAGGVQVAVFWKVAASEAETNPVITFNAGAVAATPSAAVASSYSKGAGETWLTPVGDGSAFAAATSISDTVDSHISATNGDLIEVLIATNDNTTLTVPTFTQTGLTLAAVVESPATALSSATSNDISADGCYRIATAGTSSAAAVVTGTNSVADEGCVWTTRLRVEASNPQLVTPTTLAVVLATFAPTILLTNNQLVTPGVASLATATFSPTVSTSANQTVTPSTASLTLATFVPQLALAVTPPAASLATSTFAPTVTTSDHQTVTPGVSALALETFSPTVTATAHQTVTPVTAAVSLTAFEPTVTATDHQTVTPSVASLAMTAFDPSVVATDHKVVTPDVAALTLTPFAPNVAGGAGLTVTPGLASLTLSAFAPTVATTGNVTVTPELASLALTAFAPDVVATDQRIVTPSSATLVFSMKTPTVNIGGALVELPDDLSVTVGWASTPSASVSLPSSATSVALRSTITVEVTLE